MKDVARAVAAGAYEEQGTALVVAGETLAADEFTWRTRSTAEPGFASRDGVAVALDLGVDESLLREANARELARAVQDLRKQARLRYGEPVVVAFVGPPGAEVPELAALLDEHERWLAQQCSAVAVLRASLAAALASTTVDVAGTAVSVQVGAVTPSESQAARDSRAGSDRSAR
jgi:hypothetical protein